MKANDLPEQGSFEVLPSGLYTLGVKKIEGKVSEKSGQMYLRIQYVVTEGEYFKKTVFDNVSLSPKALWMLKKWLLALDQADLDLPIEDGADVPVIDEQGCLHAIISAVVGAEVQAELTVLEADQERGWPERNDIVEYLKPAGMGVKWDD